MEIHPHISETTVGLHYSHVRSVVSDLNNNHFIIVMRTPKNDVVFKSHLIDHSYILRNSMDIYWTIQSNDWMLLFNKLPHKWSLVHHLDDMSTYLVGTIPRGICALSHEAKSI